MLISVPLQVDRSSLRGTSVVRAGDDKRATAAYIQIVLSRVTSRLGDPDPWVIDAAFAIGLSAWVLGAELGGGTGRVLVLLVMTCSIAGRRRAPLTVLVVQVAGAIALPGRLDFPTGISFFFAAYSAVLLSARRSVVIALLVIASAWQIAYGAEVDIPKALVPLLLVVPVWLAGAAVRGREVRAEAADLRANRLEAEREQTLRTERERIARELHDVVTHSVSLMVLQAGAARQIMSRDEQRSKSLLALVEASGRAALEELRRLLGLLSDEDTDTPLSPQPGINEIPELVEHVRSVGGEVELCVDGEPRAVSGGIAIAAYRVLQEALTNVLKHADGASARVVLRWTDDELELEITDEGPRANHMHDGRGIAGMRERTAMYGGTLDAGPRANHGFAVRARFPLDPRCT